MRPLELIIFLEGYIDRMFFESVFLEKFRAKYGEINIIEYSSMPKEDRRLKLRKLENTGEKYLILGDFDNELCISRKKPLIQRTFGGNVQQNRIFIVKSEIESWYQAGLSHDKAAQLHLPYTTDTQEISKDKFYHGLDKNKYPTEYLLDQILDDYDVSNAKELNASFAYFVSKLLD